MLSDSRVKKLKKFLNKLGLESSAYSVISAGVTHPSYIFENNIHDEEHYERLEFLGDAVLKMAASKYLFEKYPEYNEGFLTKIRSFLVSDNIIEKFARKIGIPDVLQLGNSELNKTKASILACSFEGLLGALYLTTDYDSIYKFLVNIFETVVEDIDKNNKLYNAKAVLQEYTQSKSNELPNYEVIKETGPEHNKIFEVEVFYQEKSLAKGEGKTKKEAQQNAAMKACKDLGILKDEKE